MSIIEKKVITQLVEQELALKVYLDSLLFENIVDGGDESVVTPSPQAEEEPAEHHDKTKIATLPEWRNGNFESLYFKVAGGLMLSVPLASLNGIVPWPAKLTVVPGYADWFLGLLCNRGNQVNIVDIAKFVIPENHKARNMLMSGERQLKHIILVDDGRFGLACDELGGILKLTQGQVRWRQDKSTRPWLAGTIIEKMCALLDVEHFVMMLKEEVPLDDISEGD